MILYYTIIPKKIHIENLVLIDTGNLRIICDVACKTNVSDPNQAGMIYYIPYNWKVEKDSSLTTSLLVSGTILSSILKSGVSAAAACLLVVPTPLLQIQQYKFSPPDQI